MQKPINPIIATGLGILAISGCQGNKPIQDRGFQKPNIVYILADDLGYGDLGCYGQKITETPNIDSLAGIGIRFTQYYSGSPVSAPSRCVLLTGKHTGHAFIRGNYEWPERGEVWNYIKMEQDPKLEGQYPIPKESKTFSKMLQAEGYKTACIGKWGLGAPFTDGIPNKQGFNHFFGYNCQRQAHTYYPAHLWRNEEIVKLDNEFVVPKTTQLDKDADPYKSESYAKFNLKQYAPELMINEALSFIRTTRNQPFCLFFTTIIPHVPLQAPKEWVEKYRKKIGDEQPYLKSEGYFPCRYPRATYAAMISYLDYQVGRIVKELKELGLYENTIIIFSSDNGPINSGGTESTFFESTKPFNPASDRQKGSVFEGGIRVPFIISWPEKIKKARDNKHICAAWDIFPTLCDIVGAEAPEGLDGISMLPGILQEGEQGIHNYLYWEYPERGGQQAVRMGNWKAIRKDIFKANLKIQLFDLEKDITEDTDVADQNPEIIKQIEEIMKKEHQKPELEKFDLFR